MYELIILSRLMIRPAHGYLIAQILNDIIGPYAKVSNGRLYPLLAKLEADGLIIAYEAVDQLRDSGRQVRSYEITAAGRKRWRDLMMDTTSNPGEYQKLFLQKSPYLHLLQPAERLHLLDHYLNYCQAHVLHLLAETADLKRLPAEIWQQDNLDDVLDAMQHMIEQWQLELAWAQQLRTRELDAAASPAETTLTNQLARKESNPKWQLKQMKHPSWSK